MNIGELAPDFKLVGTDNINHELSDFNRFKVLVVVFTCNHCPYAQSYVSRIQALSDDFSLNVQFILINSNDSKQYEEDSFENMILVSKKKGFAFPYLHDKSQSVAKLFDAKVTPECFVFDSKRRLIYNGAIDDNWKEPELALQPYLEKAIISVLENSPLEKQVVESIGCSIKWKQ